MPSLPSFSLSLFLPFQSFSFHSLSSVFSLHVPTVSLLSIFLLCFPFPSRSSFPPSFSPLTSVSSLSSLPSFHPSSSLPLFLLFVFLPALPISFSFLFSFLLPPFSALSSLLFHIPFSFPIFSSFPSLSFFLSSSFFSPSSLSGFLLFHFPVPLFLIYFRCALLTLLSLISLPSLSFPSPLFLLSPFSFSHPNSCYSFPSTHTEGGGWGVEGTFA